MNLLIGKVEFLMAKGFSIELGAIRCAVLAAAVLLAPVPAPAQAPPSDAEVALTAEEMPDDAAAPPSGEVQRYLHYALDLMEEHSINRGSIDWGTFRRAVMERARGAHSTADAHDALRFALRELNDGHSFLMTGARAAAAERNVAAAPVGPGPRRYRAPLGQLLDDSVGYLRIPGFFRAPHEAQRAFAERAHDLIGELQAAGACRWVIDLRENVGGNLWPMLLAVGPLLGEGEAGAAVYPDGRRVPFWYEEGRAGFGDYVQLRVFGETPRLREPYPPVAVLTGPRTASSGEALAVAFRARPRARSFGAETRGVSTGTRTFPLSDGAAMVLTVATTADRAGTVYGGVIAPDQRVSLLGSDGDLASQPLVQVAAGWLREQECL